MLELKNIDDAQLANALETKIRIIYRDVAHVLIELDKLLKAFDERNDYYNQLKEEFSHVTFCIAKDGE